MSCTRKFCESVTCIGVWTKCLKDFSPGLANDVPLSNSCQPLVFTHRSFLRSLCECCCFSCFGLLFFFLFFFCCEKTGFLMFHIFVNASQCMQIVDPKIIPKLWAWVTVRCRGILFSESWITCSFMVGVFALYFSVRACLRLPACTSRMFSVSPCAGGVGFLC